MKSALHYIQANDVRTESISAEYTLWVAAFFEDHRRLGLIFVRAEVAAEMITK